MNRQTNGSAPTSRADAFHECACSAYCGTGRFAEHCERQWQALTRAFGPVAVADRRIIRTSLADNDYVDQLQYQHLAPVDHSVLWVSAPVACCYQAGDEWTKRAEPIVGESTKLG